MSKIISDELLAALREVGIATENTRRVVIDMKAGRGTIVHIEQWGDRSLLNVIRALDGVEIERVTDGQADRPSVDDA